MLRNLTAILSAAVAVVVALAGCQSETSPTAEVLDSTATTIATVSIDGDGTLIPIIATTSYPTPAPAVQVIYGVPADREPNPQYISAINHGVYHVQHWYAEQLDGYTFSIHGQIPQVCDLRNPAEYYETKDGWNRVLNDLQHCAPIAHGSREYVWVVYVNVLSHCELSEFGRGGDGVTILSQGDLDGLVDPETYIHCSDPPRGTYGYIGGLAHELGHAIGLEHPPGCEEGLDSCAFGALMWEGYVDYPNTYFTEIDLRTLEMSSFLKYRLTKID